MLLLSIFSEFLPFLVYLFFYKKLTNKALKVFFYYTLSIALFSVVSIFLIKTFVFKMALLKFFSLIEFGLLSAFFLFYLRKKILKILILSCAIVFLILFFKDLHPLINRPKDSLTFELLYFIIVIVIFLFQRMKEIVSVPISSSISFWIAVGLLIYFSGNFFNILFTDQANDPKLKAQMLGIYSTIIITKNILICFALLGTEKDEVSEENISFPGEDDFHKLDISNN